MPDRWQWDAWGADLRALWERRSALERVLRGVLAVAGLVGTGVLVLVRDLSVTATVAVAAWVLVLVWFGIGALFAVVTATRRRAVLREARDRVGVEAESLASDELERLLTSGRTESRGLLVEAVVDGDHVVVSRRPIPDEWLAGCDGDPTVPFSGM